MGVAVAPGVLISAQPQKHSSSNGRRQQQQTQKQKQAKQLQQQMANSSSSQPQQTAGEALQQDSTPDLFGKGQPAREAAEGVVGHGGVAEVHRLEALALRQPQGPGVGHLVEP